MTPRGFTDYEAELTRIDGDISALSGDPVTPGTDPDTATKHAYRLYHRASLTGLLGQLQVAQGAVDQALSLFGPHPDLCLLKAHVDFTLHRFSAVLGDLAMAPGVSDSVRGRAIRADVDVQQGRYAEARAGYAVVLAQDRGWENLARLAHLEAQTGNVDSAHRFYAEAADDITAKQMRAYAWVELQRGLLDFRHRRHHSAWSHYRLATEAYSGYWLIDQHMGELLAAEGRWEEAAALYEDVLVRVDRPELQQALGDLYVLIGRLDEAQRRHDEALHGYLASAARDELHYLHHLTQFYADVRQDGAEATKWARRDLEVRQSWEAHAALAWALYRAGQLSEAMDAMDRALASGAQDAGLLSRAARIHLAAAGGQPAR